MSHCHLTTEERACIELFISQGMSCREIARRLGGSHTSVSRELNRNSSKSGYRAQTADCRARKRRAMPRHYRCMSREMLAEEDPLVTEQNEKVLKGEQLEFFDKLKQGPSAVPKTENAEPAGNQTAPKPQPLLEEKKNIFVFNYQVAALDIPGNRRSSF